MLLWQGPYTLYLEDIRKMFKFKIQWENEVEADESEGFLRESYGHSNNGYFQGNNMIGMGKDRSWMQFQNDEIDVEGLCRDPEEVALTKYFF